MLTQPNSSKDLPEDLIIQNAALRREVEQLRLEKVDLQLMLELTTEHADNVTDELQDLTECLQKRAAQLELSSQVGQQITSILKLADLLPEVVKAIQTRFDYYFVGLFLLNEAQSALILQAKHARQGEHNLVLGFALSLNSNPSIVATASQTSAYYLCNDVRSEPLYREVDSLPDTRSELALPLRLGEHKLGVLDIQSERLEAFVPDDARELQSLADQIAIAVRNAQLYDRVVRFNERLEQLVHERTEALHLANRELFQAYDATIEGWAQALELRDQETEGHAQRVMLLTEDLAIRLGIEPVHRLHLRRGALLHDIGKMGVPDNILFKEGPLDEAEWVIMRRHPQYAYEMLARIPYLRPALEIPYSHHERWDGSGYPLGLKGEEIPLAARIFAVVDVWDALTSDRPYRAAWPRPKVLEYLRQQANQAFDPQVVEAFLEVIRLPESAG